jgi:hypothetical protein
MPENITGVTYNVACKYFYVDVAIVSNGLLTDDVGQWSRGTPLSATRLNQK